MIPQKILIIKENSKRSLDNAQVLTQTEDETKEIFRSFET